MTTDVERVARLIAEMRQTEIGADWGNFDDYTEEGRQYALNEARAAMAVTREIDAEAIKGDYMLTFPMRVYLADWLQERANDVKETGRG